VIVVDASVLVNSLTDDGSLGEAAREALRADRAWVGPEHLQVEVFSAIRGRYLGGKVSAARGGAAVEALADLTVTRVETRMLLNRMWALRDRCSGYDAAYVAIAEVYRCPLVTADGRLARAAGGLCDVHAIG